MHGCKSGGSGFDESIYFALQKHDCAKKAEALGVRVARLPIDPSFLDGQKINARKVLTVNQVFAILVGWTETRDWTAALKRGLPTRKFENEESS